VQSELVIYLNHIDALTVVLGHLLKFWEIVNIRYNNLLCI